MSSRLHVLFEDEHCLAVLKPAGQFTQGTWAPPDETTLEQDVRRHLDPNAPESVYVGIVHRLDRPVSGVLLWAKTTKAARRLAMQFEKRQAVKEYWAIVEVAAADSERLWPTHPDAKSAEGLSGLPPIGETWTDWLTSAGETGVVQSVEAGTPGARQAVTRVIGDMAAETPDGCRWLRLWPETGRTHQLRVQSAVRGMPILGDLTYGARLAFPSGIALHARSLQVRHPTLTTPLILIAPLPACWQEQGVVISTTPPPG